MEIVGTIACLLLAGICGTIFVGLACLGYRLGYLPKYYFFGKMVNEK